MVDGVGDVARQGLDRELACDLLEHATLLDAGRVLRADQVEDDGGGDCLVEPDSQHVDVGRLAGHRVARQLLDDDRCAPRAVDAELEHRAGVLERVAQLPRVNLEGDGVLAPAVDDPGHVAGPAQTARRARSRGFAALDWKGCRLGGGHGRPRW